MSYMAITTPVAAGNLSVIPKAAVTDGSHFLQSEHWPRRFFVPSPAFEYRMAGVLSVAAISKTIHVLVGDTGFLKQLGITVDCLAGEAGRPAPETLANNIENLVGFAQVPVAVIGPLRINGIEAHGNFFVPMATSEGALVASYHRGAYVISHAGGAAAICLTETISRAPCFVFKSTFDACLFLEFAMQESSTFQERISKTSGHCKFMELRSALAGRNLYLGFDYQTGDAAGQNMVTLATDALCRFLVEKAPVKPERWYVEGNMSGDKKATMLSFLSARGKKVIAEVVIPAALLKKIIHVMPLQMIQYGHAAMLGGTQSGRASCRERV